MQLTLRSYPSRSRSDGFSLVELVVVITLLGVLCSFAIPRFTRLENDARASEVVALSLHLRSASAAAHAQYLESGRRVSSVNLEGRTIQLTNGYPDAGPHGIRLAVPDLSSFTVSSSPTSVTFSKTGAQAAAQCAVTYRVSPAAPSVAAITDLYTGGC
jgi:prepilin-type N-terminal cleavage/methylation domain-containing protein